MKNPAVLNELRSLSQKRNGILMPEDVVKAARNEESAMHSWFEWDDNEAAEKYRIWQARQLLRVTVDYIQTGDDRKEFCVFVSLTSDRRQGGYRQTVEVLSDKALRQQLLEDALSEMERFEQKYRDLQELAGLFAAMKKTRKRVA